MSMARLISGDQVSNFAILLAEAEIDLLRIRAIRYSMVTGFYEREDGSLRCCGSTGRGTLLVGAL